MTGKVRKNFRLTIILFLVFCFIENNLFGAKASDYVNKSDIENVKKIFIYEVPKKVQTNKNENSENNNKNSKENGKNNQNTSKSNTLESQKIENKKQEQNQVPQTVK